MKKSDLIKQICLVETSVAHRINHVNSEHTVYWDLQQFGAEIRIVKDAVDDV